MPCQMVSYLFFLEELSVFCVVFSADKQYIMDKINFVIPDGG